MDTCCPVETETAIKEHFDSRAEDHIKRYREYGLEPSSKILMQFLVDNTNNGIRDKTVLDLGCGSGVFSVEALKNGAASAVGVDLSSEMVSTAAKLADSAGFEERAKFEIGDAAQLSHPVSDIVVLDKVICCYPEMDMLLNRAADSSRDIVGFVVPRDKGIPRLAIRVGVAMENLVVRLRRTGRTKMYLHPLNRIDWILSGKGFRKEKTRGSGFWLIAVYKRPARNLSG